MADWVLLQRGEDWWLIRCRLCGHEGTRKFHIGLGHPGEALQAARAAQRHHLGSDAHGAALAAFRATDGQKPDRIAAARRAARSAGDLRHRLPL